VADFGIAWAVGQSGGEQLTETGAHPGHPGLHESRAGSRGASPRRTKRHLLSGLRCL
jgi:hypothetical protein